MYQHLNIKNALFLPMQGGIFGSATLGRKQSFITGRDDPMRQTMPNLKFSSLNISPGAPESWGQVSH
jgi:hypothetical protein